MPILTKSAVTPAKVGFDAVLSDATPVLDIAISPDIAVAVGTPEAL